MAIDTTNVITNNPAPYRAPILYDIPSFESDATIAVNTSPAPLAKASKVTPAKDSLSFKYSHKYTIAGATYSSIVLHINLNKMISNKITKKIVRILLPFISQK